MEPLSAIPPSPERIRYEREEDTRHTIDQRIHLLAAQEKKVQEAVQKIQQNPTCIPSVIQQLKKEYAALTHAIPPTALVEFLQKALQGIREQQNILYQEQAAILAPLTQLHETIWMVITDQAPNETKATIAQVSRGWKERTIASLKHEYAHFIQHKMDQYIAALTKKDEQDKLHSREEILEQVRNELEAIQSDDFHEVRELQHVKPKVFDVRNRVLHALTQLDPLDFSRIPSTPAPMSPCQLDFPYNVFHLITQFLSPDITGKTGEKLALDLLQQRDSIVACRIANEIADTIDKDDLLLQIATTVATTDIDRALEIANSIVELECKNKTLCDIASTVAKTGRIEQALEIVRRIAHSRDKDNALCDIAAEVAKTDIDRALGITTTIVCLELKDLALGDIASTLATTDIDRALEIATGLQEDLLSQEHVLCSIVHRVAKTNIDRALEIANRTSSRLLGEKDKELSIIAVTASTTDINRALEIANTIEASEDDSEDKDQALREIASTLAKTNIDRALEIANTIDDSKYKAKALREIASTAATTGKIDRALEIANTIARPVRKAQALHNIASTLAATGVIDQAREIASTIVLSQYKDLTLNNIAYMQEKIALAKSR